ncbi:MAG: FecR domain-containing protein [Spirochaetales bacterium]|nr:FecR domain-containing protein [Spirochaetales bacterium]
MKRIFYIFFLILFFAGLHTAFSEDVIGYIDSLTGNVEITRDGEVYESFDLEQGDDIENFDLVRTSGKGEITIIIDSDLCPGTAITIEPDTTFTIEINKLKGKNQTTLDLITGGLALKVKGLTKNQELNVETEGAVMGVRGTSFGVGSSPGGDVLITCDEGKVECSSEGKKLHAIPGEAVELQPGELFRQIPVKISDIKKFRQEWIAERIEAFKPNALRAIKFYGKQYIRLLNTFNNQYEQLMKKEAIIQKWMKEKKEGKTGSRMEIMREKRQLIGVLFRIRRTLFIFERVYFRLLELQTYYKQGYGKGEFSEGMSVKEFFKEFDNTSAGLYKKVAQIRFVIKLFAIRNEGSFPAEIEDEDDSDF